MRSISSIAFSGKYRLVTAEFSGATGSEILNVAVVWFLVEHVGYESGYLIALTLLSAILFGTFGVKPLSKLGSLQTAVTLNIARAIVAVFMFLLVLETDDPWLVVLLAMTASAVRPHIDSAVIGAASDMQMTLSQRTTLNALIDGTYRLARVVGPAIASLFIWNSSYLFLVSVWLFSQAAALFKFIEPEESEHTSYKIEPAISFVKPSASRVGSVTNLFFFSQAVNAGAWYSGIVFGLAVVIGSDGSNGGIAVYSFALLSYGVGNIVGTVIGRLVLPFISNLLALGLGRSIASAGYLGLFWSPSYEFIWLFTFIIAAATPPCDLAFLRHIQGGDNSRNIKELYRKKMICEYSGMLLALVISPSIAVYFSGTYIILVASIALFVATLLLAIQRIFTLKSDIK